MAYDYDLFVIGAGSGGVRAARIAAGYGAKVAVAEDYRIGGTCVIRGCVPKKLLVYAAHFSEDFRDAAGYGWTVGETRFDWKALIAAKDREIDRLNAAYARNLDASGATTFAARARLVDEHTLDVGGRAVTAQTILIATGAAPDRPDIPGKELGITSNEAFHLPELPGRIAVIGAGYIAVEFAGIFRGLGAQVHLVHRGPRLLRGFDEDVATRLATEYGHKGIDVRLNASPLRIERRDGGLALHLRGGSVLDVDAVMFATGRRPATAGLGLENAGVKTGPKGEVLVDLYSRTSVSNIYAVGDVTDRVNLTPVAIREGHAFADTVYGNRPTATDHLDIPTAVFSQPPIGTVGLTETQALVLHETVDIYEADFRSMRNTLAGNPERSYMKLVVEPRSDRVIGIHMIATDAAELIQVLGIAVKMGATKAQFDRTIAVHPTAAEELVLMRRKSRTARLPVAAQ